MVRNAGLFVEDYTLGIDQENGRNPQHAEGPPNLGSMIVTNGHRIPVFFPKSPCPFFAVIRAGIYGKHDESLLGILVRQPADVRKLASTDRAPGIPEDKHQRFALQTFTGVCRAVESPNAEIRHRVHQLGGPAGPGSESQKQQYNTCKFQKSDNLDHDLLTLIDPLPATREIRGCKCAIRPIPIIATIIFDPLPTRLGSTGYPIPR